MSRRSDTPVDAMVRILTNRFIDYPDVLYSVRQFDGWWGVLAEYTHPQVDGVVSQMNYHEGVKSEADVKRVVSLLE